MKKQTLNNYLVPAATASLVMLGACGEEEEASINYSDQLVGEWNIVSIDGETYESDESSYRLFFKFEADGDFGFCYEYESGSIVEQDCYEGDWNWITEGEVLEFGWSDTYTDEQTGETYNYELDIEMAITKFTEAELEGVWEVSADGVTETYVVVLEKRD